MSENQIDEYKVIHRGNQQDDDNKKINAGKPAGSRENLHAFKKEMTEKLHKLKQNCPVFYGLCAAVVLIVGVVAAYAIPAVKYAYDMRGKTKIALFDNVQVVFAGMSPEAYAQVQNNWEDEYLKGLQFTVDRTTEIKVGDTVTVTCQTPAEEMKEHGFVVDTTTASFKADKLNAYANASDQVDIEYLKKISDEATATIVSETADTTFRMLYKATEDASYLRTVNNEEAENIHLQQALFLSRKNPLEGDANNYIYMIFVADIANQDTTMPVYFVFSYRDGYVTAEGSYEINHDQQEKRYQCGVDYDALYESVIGIYEGTYNMSEISW